MTKNLLHDKDIISINDLSIEQISFILKTAEQFKKKPPQNLLQGKLIANCFFEPSTRTRLSFEAAALRLGAQNIGFSEATTTSTKKGETLRDTIRVISEYADLIVIRHPKEGAARLAAEISTKPVINAGDGSNQHPTQALIDLFTIKECQKKLEGLNIALAGDLKYGRAVHSLVLAASLFGARFFLIAPELLSLPEQICDVLKKRRIKFSSHHSIEEVIPKIDILYMSRIQQERFEDNESIGMKSPYSLTLESLEKAKPSLKVLHPLPRVNEISVSVDKTPYAHYFDQAANGVWIRQALLFLLLNR